MNLTEKCSFKTALANQSIFAIASAGLGVV